MWCSLDRPYTNTLAWRLGAHKGRGLVEVTLDPTNSANEVMLCCAFFFFLFKTSGTPSLGVCGTPLAVQLTIRR